jgi:hypothetical protein
MFSLDEDAIENLVIGAAILGTGGGGDPKKGLDLLLGAVRSGLNLNVVSLDELPEDSYIVCPFHLGTVAPSTEGKVSVIFNNPMEIAIKKMRELLKKKVDATIATEIGGFNTAIAIYIAASLNLPAVDADLGGRASPELHQNTVNIFDIPRYPCVIVSRTGNLVVVERYANIDDLESIARHISTLAGGFISVVNTPLDVFTSKKVAVHGTISKCIKVGATVKESIRKGLDTIEQLVTVLDGYFLFKGIVEKYDWKDEGGFLIGKVFVKGINQWEGHEFESWIKNEHIIAFRDGTPIVMPPDLISFIDEKGHAIMNSELKKGVVVNVIGTKAPEIWRTRKGLELFGPKHFGFNYEYTPIEKLVNY